MRWDDVSLRYITSVNQETLPEETPPGLAFRYVDISAVSENGDISLPADTTTFEDAPSRARRLAQANDVVISTVRTYLRAIATVPDTEEQLVFSTGFAVLHAGTSLDPRYLGYACSSERFISSVVAHSSGVSYPAINSSDLTSLQIPLPPLEEQRRIADFLDDQTTRINNIITARQKQIRLLETADRADLDSTFDSLDRRFGSSEVRRFTEGIEQGWSPQCDSVPALPSEWGVTKVGAVKKGEFRPAENKRLPDSAVPRPEYEVHSGDLLITRANTPELVGDMARVPDGVRSRLILCDKIMRVRLSSRMDTEYLALAGRTSKARAHFTSASSGTSQSMVNIRAEDVRNLRVPTPGVLHQRQTANELLARMAVRRDSVYTLVAQGRLLEELRQSLISAAVSGEFDVATADGSQVRV